MGIINLDPELLDWLEREATQRRAELVARGSSEYSAFDIEDIVNELVWAAWEAAEGPQA